MCVKRGVREQNGLVIITNIIYILLINIMLAAFIVYYSFDFLCFIL